MTSGKQQSWFQSIFFRKQRPSGFKLVHFIIPVYNKEDSLPKNIQWLSYFLESRLKENYEIVLSDDGSTDASFGIAKKLEKSLPNMRVVGYPDNRGRGYAVKFAGQTCQGTHIIFADLDFPQTTSLEKILEMFALLKENQVVIGSRFHPESRTERIWLRSVVSCVYRLFVRVLFPRLKIHDPDIGFKGFQRPSFEKISLLSRMDRWSWDLEVMAIARRNNLLVAEIPISWNERHEKRTSSVRLFRDSWEEFLGMLRIKKGLLKGIYDFKD